MDRENRRFAVAEACFCGEQDVFYSHAALRGGIHPIVNGAEGDLRASAGVHRVEIMNERFHRLIGGAVRLFHSAAQREFLRTLYDGVVELIALFQQLCFSLLIAVIICKLGY